MLRTTGLNVSLLSVKGFVLRISLMIVDLGSSPGMMI